MGAFGGLSIVVVETRRRSYMCLVKLTPRDTGCGYGAVTSPSYMKNMAGRYIWKDNHLHWCITTFPRCYRRTRERLRTIYLRMSDLAEQDTK